MLLHLALDTGLEAVEVGLANPIRSRVHSARYLVADLRRSMLGGDGDAARARCAGERRVRDARRGGGRTLPKLLGTRMQRIGERVLHLSAALTHRRSDVGELVLCRAGDLARTVGEARRWLSGAVGECLPHVCRGAGGEPLRSGQITGVAVARRAGKIPRTAGPAPAPARGRRVI